MEGVDMIGNLSSREGFETIYTTWHAGEDISQRDGPCSATLQKASLSLSGLDAVEDAVDEVNVICDAHIDAGHHVTVVARASEACDPHQVAVSLDV